jgi:hypothetical protein
MVFTSVTHLRLIIQLIFLIYFSTSYQLFFNDLDTMNSTRIYQLFFNDLGIISSTMPVLTHSQTKQLQSLQQTSPTHSTTIVSTNPSADDLILYTPPSPSQRIYINRSSLLAISDTTNHLYSSIATSASDDPSFLSSSISKFENLKLPNDHFQNPTISNCSVSSTTSVPLFECLESSQLIKMEENSPHLPSVDCSDHSNVDIISMFQTLSHQLAVTTSTIQDHILKNEEKQNLEYTKLVHDNECFKRDIQVELQELHQLLIESRSPVTPVPLPTTFMSNTSVPTVASSPSAIFPPSVFTSTATSSPTDIHAQMMLMLTESFSKLSNVLQDKSLESKTEWPKFSGDPKKFHAWYLSIMTQISLPQWQSLYDPVTHDIVTSTSNSSLNGQLYAKVLASLEGQALQDVVTRKHLRAKGVMLLQELVQYFQPKNIPEVIAAKTGEFWSSTKHLPNESVDDYYTTRFHELLDDLNQADDPISTKSTICHFIFTLGSEFAHIQNNFRIGNLPTEWRTQDWPTLLALCRDYSNSINPSSITKKNPLKDPTLSFDCPAHHKKVIEWFSNPTKYKKEIEQGQLKYPGKCIYHLTKTHPTDDCYVKKAFTQASHNHTSTQDPSNTRGHLRNIKEEDFEVDLPDEDQDDCELVDNDTNNEVLHYFAYC